MEFAAVGWYSEHWLNYKRSYLWLLWNLPCDGVEKDWVRAFLGLVLKRWGRRGGEAVWFSVRVCVCVCVCLECFLELMVVVMMSAVSSCMVSMVLVLFGADPIWGNG